MSATITNIFRCETYFVNFTDDREGDQVAIVANIPFIKRAVVMSTAKAADLKAGTAPLKALAPGLEKEFLVRIGALSEEKAMEPSPKEEGERNPGAVPVPGQVPRGPRGKKATKETEDPNAEE